MPSGEVHYFARCGADRRSGELTKFGPLATDALAGVVKLDRAERVRGTLVIDGTSLKYRGAEVGKAGR
jgi:hypothetical protein